DRKSGKFVAEDYMNDENSMHDYIFLIHFDSLADVYDGGKIFFYKPKQQAEYMNRTYGFDVEIVEFTRIVKYEEVAE
ncbi:MAG: hypothetical protein ACRDB7_06765, partial [Fusobacteriaceae bacterium]